MSEEVSVPPGPPVAEFPPMAAPGHEFGPEENRVIGDLASYSRSVGLVAILLGALAFVISILILDVSCFIQALLYLCVGVWIRRAATSFQRIVDTKENDIPHLMVALKELKNVFALLYYVILLAIILFLIFLTVILVFGLRAYFATSAGAS